MTVLEINRNGLEMDYVPNGPHMHPPGTYETCLILSLGPIPTWKVDATITKLGWISYMTPFSKWLPAKWSYAFVYNSSPRIDTNNILLSNEVISWSLQAPIFHSYMGKNQWPLKPQRLEFVPSMIVHEVQQSFRTNLSWCMWWIKIGAQMPLFQCLCW